MVNKCWHKLPDVLFIALCTLLSNGEDFEDMAEYGKQKEAWLRTRLELRHGIPSHDTFNRVFQLIEPEELRSCLAEDGQLLLDSLEGGLINLDGKKIKGESPKSRGNKGLFILSAWVSEQRICIGQQKLEDKSNEITAIPKVLDSIDLAGSTVSIDAIGCQKAIAQQIVDKQAYYLLAVKGNQSDLLEEVVENFTHFIPAQQQEDWEYDHGRYEHRSCSVLCAKQALSPKMLVLWEDVQQLIRIESKRVIKHKTCCETRYYISNRPNTDAAKFNELTRGHWGIENHLHWHLDVTFSEDACRARTGHAAENLNCMRKIALHRLARSQVNISLKKRRFRASLNQEYLEQILDL